jgi:hypothetical protein
MTYNTALAIIESVASDLHKKDPRMRTIEKDRLKELNEAVQALLNIKK